MPTDHMLLVHTTGHSFAMPFSKESAEAVLNQWLKWLERGRPDTLDTLAVGKSRTWGLRFWDVVAMQVVPAEPSVHARLAAAAEALVQTQTQGDEWKAGD